MPVVRVAGGGDGLSEEEIDVVDAFLAEELDGPTLEPYADGPRPRVISRISRPKIEPQIDGVDSLTLAADEDVERFILEEGD